MRLAVDYWHTYHSDVVVDLVCYRRWGHNELDDPTFTQPLMYEVIQQKKSPPDQYAEQLVQKSVATPEELNATLTPWRAQLEADFQKADSIEPPDWYLKGRWSSMRLPRRDVITSVQTGVPVDTLKFVARQSVTFPSEFVR